MVPSRPPSLQSCVQWGSLEYKSLPACPGRHRQNTNIQLLGGPELPLETFNQIHISYVQSMYQEKLDKKSRDFFLLVLGPSKIIHQIKFSHTKQPCPKIHLCQILTNSSSTVSEIQKLHRHTEWYLQSIGPSAQRTIKSYCKQKLKHWNYCATAPYNTICFIMLLFRNCL